MNSSILERLIQSELPARIRLKIKAVLYEESNYAADELVELSEEIMLQIAAVGMAYYINDERNQKEIYNDFIIQVFTSSGNDINARPLYRWVANMVKNNEDLESKKALGFYWKDGALNSKVDGLGELRNAVMHGFFILPPERNILEAERIGLLLQELVSSQIFHHSYTTHFVNSEGFTGYWNIKDESSWQLLNNNTEFGILSQRIISENSDEFWNNENAAFNLKSELIVSKQLQEFILNNSKGIYGIWGHPADEQSSIIYSITGRWLRDLPDTIFVGYCLHAIGISFTKTFLLNRLIDVLSKKLKEQPDKKKKLEVQLKTLRAKYDGKVVVLINQIHIALFGHQHVLQFRDFLYENNILLVVIGHGYEYFKKSVNNSEALELNSILPSKDEKDEVLLNYLRFKGPNADNDEEAQDVERLRSILDTICIAIEQEGEVYARRFADKNQYSIEEVQECFAILWPWLKHRREPFEMDEVDELCGFPTKMTETTAVFMSLGRRDVKLEYQHRVLFK